MTAAQLLRTLRVAPFRPFTTHFADGRSIAVRHPEAVQLLGGGRIAQVWDPVLPEPDNYEIVDVLMVVSLRPVDARSRP